MRYVSGSLATASEETPIGDRDRRSARRDIITNHRKTKDRRDQPEEIDGERRQFRGNKPPRRDNVIMIQLEELP